MNPSFDRKCPVRVIRVDSAMSAICPVKPAGQFRTYCFVVNGVYSLLLRRAVIRWERGNQGVAMKTPLTMPEEQQPKNIKRADVLMTEGFDLEVDGRMKASFPTE